MRWVQIRIGVMLWLMIIGIANAQEVQQAKLRDAFAALNKGKLVIGNGTIERTWDWNGGHLVTRSLKNKETGFVWQMDQAAPDWFGSGLVKKDSGSIRIKVHQNDPAVNDHIEVIVITHFQEISVKRSFSVFPEVPVIRCAQYVKGNGELLAHRYNAKGRLAAPHMERLAPKGVHWQTKVVAFADRTDDNNNLVATTEQWVYTNQNRLVGNLLYVKPLFGDHSFFILKESPDAFAQLGYPGADFVTKQTKQHYLNLTVVGLNALPSEISSQSWTRIAGFATGVASGDEYSQLWALKAYQRKIRVTRPDRDEMIMMNTWGDRGRDAKISEDFCLQELEAAHKLGITHFQIDDGWQIGKTGNSAYAGGSLDGIWEQEDYWKVDPDKFPKGLNPVLQKAQKYGIEVGLWFNPSHDDSYANWRKDAEVLLSLYQQYGIRVFKIDGGVIADKLAEENFRNLLDSVKRASNHEVMINLDVTGLAKRPGYHFFNEYGNVFLENRYTDWGNYYPHWTLRNLWMLSKYVPTQNLQVEFLNPWRNQERYAQADSLAPGRVPFDYLFAITMMAQPLAWLEGSGLPEEAFSCAPILAKFRSEMEAIHQGDILPIGDEPDGTKWTGFQSITSSRTGYLVVYREYNQTAMASLQTWLPPGEKVALTPVIGTGNPETQQVSTEGKLTFSLPKKWSYALYKYQLISDQNEG